VPAVGRSGRVIGVDLTDAMLDQARARISAHRWTNVDLVNSDAGSYEFRGRVDGVFSSFALTLVPDFEDVIARAAAALAPGRALVALDLKRPDGIPEWLVRVGVFVSRPFGVTLDLADRHPWEVMGKYCSDVILTDLYFGFAYIATGRSEAAVH
jgi:demethylmenaquinone methyltransferase/2-methoxy-6-polyprenyl-1,4-benzoquinol methylase